MQICIAYITERCTYENNALRSPLTKAKSNGVPKHAGTKYSRAGCA